MDLLFGVRLILLVGKGVPLPAKPNYLEALKEIEVKQVEEGRSACKLVFHESRDSLKPSLDFPLVSDENFKIMSRIMVQIFFGVTPNIIFDGFITELQLQPGEGRAGSTFTVLCEDVRVKMDMEDKQAEHLALNEENTVQKILLPYLKDGLTANVVTKTPSTPPNPTEKTPVQTETDYMYIAALAKKNGLLFYCEPGPIPGLNKVYYGPKLMMSKPQSALSANMGPNSNVRQISFSLDGIQATKVVGKVQDAKTNQAQAVQSNESQDQKNAAQGPSPDQLRIEHLRSSVGDTVADAIRKATGQAANKSQIVKAEGELDTLRYNGILKPFQMVQVRGVGDTYNGMYFVRSVTHNIKVGSYTQKFTLTREGTGSTIPAVTP